MKEEQDRRESEEAGKRHLKNWKPELLKSNDILTVDPDRVWQKFGTFGRYQLQNLVMVSAPSLIYSALVMLMPFLLEENKDFKCIVKAGYEANYRVLDKCTVADLLSGLNRTCLELIDTATRFDWGNSSSEYSITNDFGLVCEKSDWREHGSSSFLFGAMFGATTLSYLSDKLGRRKSFLISIVISVSLNILTALSPYYWLFLVLRFIAGFGLGGNLNIGYVMMSEVCSPKMREYTPFVSTAFWVFGYMLAGVTRMYFYSWRFIYFLCNVPGILAIFVYYKYFPESLHWQVSKGQKEAITLHIQRATRINKIQINVKDCLHESSCEEIDINESSQNTKNLYWLILKSPKLVYHFILCAFLMVVMNLTYWALSLFSTELSDHKMTGFFLSGIVEFPSAFIAVILLRKLKRRPVSCLMFLLTAASLAIAVLVPPYLGPTGSWAVTIICPLLAKMFNSIVWSVLPLAMSEMIPTIIRNSFAGGVSFLGDAGSVVAPYLEHLNQFGPNTATILIAVLTGVCALGVLTMPETKGVHLISGIEHFDEGPFLRTIRRTFSRKLDSEASISKDEEAAPMMNETTKSTGKPDESAENSADRPTFFQ